MPRKMFGASGIYQTAQESLRDALNPLPCGLGGNPLRNAEGRLAPPPLQSHWRAPFHLGSGRPEVANSAPKGVIRARPVRYFALKFAPTVRGAIVTLTFRSNAPDIHLADPRLSCSLAALHPARKFTRRGKNVHFRKPITLTEIKVKLMQLTQ